MLRPKIKAKVIFSEDASAEVWVADDHSRVMLMMRTRLPKVGTATFQLSSREQIKDVARR